MDTDAFDALATRLWEQVPSPYKEKIRNVALLFEDEPSHEIRSLERLADGDTLLGLYHGIPLTERGEGYGIGVTLPDTITLYRLPILEAAQEDSLETGEILEEAVTRVTAETLWHEVGHYFGLTDAEIHEREDEGTNAFKGM